jgi:hypothetical protein
LAERIADKHQRCRDDHDPHGDWGTPEPKRAAVLGIRPIVVSGQTEDVAKAVSAHLGIVREPLGIGRITVVEEDDALCRAIRRRWGTIPLVECQSMRRIKGLERPCIVWSTRQPLPGDGDLEEWVYTILTRSVGLVFIAIGPETRPEFIPVLRDLRVDRLLFHDHEALSLWQGFSTT